MKVSRVKTRKRNRNDSKGALINNVFSRGSSLRVALFNKFFRELDYLGLGPSTGSFY